MVQMQSLVEIQYNTWKQTVVPNDQQISNLCFGTLTNVTQHPSNQNENIVFDPPLPSSLSSPRALPGHRQFQEFSDASCRAALLVHPNSADTTTLLHQTCPDLAGIAPGFHVCLEFLRGWGHANPATACSHQK